MTRRHRFQRGGRKPIGDHLVLFRRLGGLAVVLAMLCLFPRPASAQEPRPEVDETQADDSDEFQVAYPDWDLLDFVGDRKLKSVAVRTTDAVEFHRHVRPIEKPRTYQDARRLEVFQSCLDPRFVLRLGYPDDLVGGGGVGGTGGPAYALFEVETTQDNFTIGVTPLGFVLDGTHFSTKRVFYSYALAEFVEDVFLESDGPGLPSELFRGLSGEAHIDQSRRLYRALMRRSESGKAATLPQESNEQPEDAAEPQAAAPQPAAPSPPVEIGPDVLLLAELKTAADHVDGRTAPNILAVAFLDGGDRFAAVSRTGRVLVWDTASRKMVSSFSHFDLPGTHERHGVGEACFTQDGKRVCVADPFNNLSLWDVASRRLLKKRRFDANICALAISPDNNSIAIGGFDYTPEAKTRGVALLWNPATDDVKTLRPQDTDKVASVDFHPDGKLLAVNAPIRQRNPSEDVGGQHSLWNARTGELVRIMPWVGFGDDPFRFDGRGEYLVGVCQVEEPDPGGDFIVFTTYLRMWNLQTRELFRDLCFDQGALAFSTDSPKAVLLDDYRDVIIYNYQDSTEQFVAGFRRKWENPKNACLSPDSKLLLVGTTLGNVFLFQIPEEP